MLSLRLGLKVWIKLPSGIYLVLDLKTSCLALDWRLSWTEGYVWLVDK